MKKILITGLNSYIGTKVKEYLEKYPSQYSVDAISVRTSNWKLMDWSEYDVLLHVAAVVHHKEKKEMERVYYTINKELPVQVAEKAKESGINQFIFLSTMAVYGEEGKVEKKIVITKETKPNPNTFYGKSKLEAETEITKLRNGSFKVVILRPPMIYGPNCPGNYKKLEKIAQKSYIFPMVNNERSMLNIQRFCLYIKNYIDENVEGVFFPQDDKYVNTSLLVKEIAQKKGKKIYLSSMLGSLIKVFGKRFHLVNKVFGSLIYKI
ncbi:NAD-dependent epimerase/dehydratase family protein [Halobacillus campisalis]|uniref:NAD-dependent epimerase/dehydratase family protein n=1 Tax=Halobacillus campisalis TaxID=435909 RepID=A0ABW2JYX8_9BACI|nr:NAD-dependent epimerase/dehydratase family protein [Halobacillus campisalis]